MDRLERFLFDVRAVTSMRDTEPIIESIEPAELVNTSIERTGRVAGERTVKADLSSPLRTIEGDRKLLGLAVVNLLVNALKFSTPHSPIVVRVVEERGQSRIEVEDEGPGIPDEIDVWAELVRGPNAQGIPGAGLGLPLVRLIAEAHGGTADLRSSRLGTVAWISVPNR
jgi:signal transduction histidine kinase